MEKVNNTIFKGCSNGQRFQRGDSEISFPSHMGCKVTCEMYHKFRTRRLSGRWKSPGGLPGEVSEDFVAAENKVLMKIFS